VLKSGEIVLTVLGAAGPQAGRGPMVSDAPK